MKAPVKTDIIITSDYGMRTLSYINGGKPLFHPGVDIHAPQNAPIVAPCKCQVLRYGRGDYDENFIVCESLISDDVFKFIHTGFTSLVKIGKQFEKGEQIGFSDGSGTRDEKGDPAPHLHFETWHGGAGRPPKGINYNPTDFFAHNQIDFVIKAD